MEQHVKEMLEVLEIMIAVRDLNIRNGDREGRRAAVAVVLVLLVQLDVQAQVEMVVLE